jgi:hypothetical protein
LTVRRDSVRAIGFSPYFPYDVGMKGKAAVSFRQDSNPAPPGPPRFHGLGCPGAMKCAEANCRKRLGVRVVAVPFDRKVTVGGRRKESLYLPLCREHAPLWKGYEITLRYVGEPNDSE